MVSQSQRSSQGSGKGANTDIVFDFEVGEVKTPNVDKVLKSTTDAIEKSSAVLAAQKKERTAQKRKVKKQCCGGVCCGG